VEGKTLCEGESVGGKL